MPRRTKRQPARRELTPEQAERLETLRQEEFGRPIAWFRHDVDAHDDPAVALLLNEPDGFALYGMFWLLIERLAARDGHFYRVSDVAGWSVLARDLLLSPRIAEDMELCHRLMDMLAELGLISPTAYQDGFVESRRLSANCEEVSRGRASKRLTAEITNQQRWGDRNKGEGE